jgi:hypothetical protein
VSHQTTRRVIFDRLEGLRLSVHVRFAQKATNGRDLNFNAYADYRSLFKYVMHTLPSEIFESIGTSTLLAAWNAAIYVAQVEDDRVGAGDQLKGFERNRVAGGRLCPGAPARTDQSNDRRSIEDTYTWWP